MGVSLLFHILNTNISTKDIGTVLIFLNFEIVIALEESEAAGRVVAGLARVVLLIG